MLRTGCLLILLGLGFHSSINAQSGQPVQPKQLKITKASALSKIPSGTSSVSPATFLKTNQEKVAGQSGLDNDVPAILTGKQKSTTKSLPQNKSRQSIEVEIDPLNIPSSPITPRTPASLPKTSGFQPAASSFQVPSANAAPSFSTKSLPTNSSTFQPSGNKFKPGGSKPKDLTAAGNTPDPKKVTLPISNPKQKSQSSAPFLKPDSTSAKRPISPPVSPLSTGKKPSGLDKSSEEEFATRPRIQPRPGSFDSIKPQVPAATIPSPDPSPIKQKQGLDNAKADLNPVKAAAMQFNEPRIAEKLPKFPGGSLNTPKISPTTKNKPTDLANLFSSQQLGPQIKVISKGPRSISVNKAGQFQVRVANVGQVDANDLMVGIEIPQWVEIEGRPRPSGGSTEIRDLDGGKGIIWSVSLLPAGQDAVVTVNLEPKENRPFRLKTEWTTAPVSTESQVMVTQAKLQTRISGPAEVKYGEKAVYTIAIENSGNGDAEQVSVSLSETLGGDSATVGLIAAGDTKNFEVELTAGKAGPLKLEASVKGNAGLDSSIAKEIVVRRAKLVVQANGPKFKYAGSALTYTVSIENKGDATATNINAAALLPRDAEYISGLNQTTENDGRKIAWKISEIPAGSKREFTMTCLIKQAGEARMEIGVRSEDGLTSGGIVKTRIETLADLKLEVVDPRGPQAVGSEVVYELHIKNRGTKSAQNVKISGEFSDFIDPVGGTGAKATIDQGGLILFAPIPEIKVGESMIVKVMAKASQPGTHTFRAIVECEEQDIRKVSEGTTKFFGETK